MNSCSTALLGRCWITTRPLWYSTGPIQLANVATLVSLLPIPKVGCSRRKNGLHSLVPT